MTPLTRNWLIGTVAGWTLLIVGAATGSRWVLGASAVLLLVLAIERYDNWARHRGGSR